MPVHLALAATAAGGGGIGVLVVWLLSMFGVTMQPSLAAVLAAVFSTIAVAVDHRGVRGLIMRLWRGGNGKPKEDL